MPYNTAINSDVQKRRFALLLHAGYGELQGHPREVKKTSPGGFF